MMATPEQRLHAELLAAMQARTGLVPALAAPNVDVVIQHLQRRHGGERLYIPSPRRVYTLAKMRSSLRGGESYRSVAKRHGMGLRTLDQMLPRAGLKVKAGGDS